MAWWTEIKTTYNKNNMSIAVSVRTTKFAKRSNDIGAIFQHSTISSC